MSWNVEIRPQERDEVSYEVERLTQVSWDYRNKGEGDDSSGMLQVFKIFLLVPIVSFYFYLLL